MKVLNVSIRLFDNFVLIGNQPFSLWVTTMTALLPVGWFIQNPVILRKVACCKRTHSDFISCHFISRRVGNFTPTLVQNFIVNSMDLLMRISFQFIFITNGNVVADSPFRNLITTHRPFWTRVGSCFPKALMLHQLWWFITLWIYMIVCLFHVNDGRVHCEILFSIFLYLYGLWHKLCNVRFMIHFDLCYAYYHFDCLILAYKMILSLRQAFQGLAPNGSFCLP